MTVTYREDDATGVAEFRVVDHISRADYEPLVASLQDFIDRHGSVRIIEIVETFPGFDPSILLPGLRFDIRNIRHISHVAVVSDMGWLSPVVKAAGSLVSTKIRLFGMAELDEARAWIVTAD